MACAARYHPIQFHFWIFMFKFCLFQKTQFCFRFFQKPICFSIRFLSNNLILCTVFSIINFFQMRIISQKPNFLYDFFKKQLNFLEDFFAKHQFSFRFFSKTLIFVYNIVVFVLYGKNPKEN